MKNSVFITIVLVIAFGISFVIYQYLLPDFIRDGGPLVIALLTLTIMVITFIVERIFSLWRAQGKRSASSFLKEIQTEVNEGRIDEAIALCEQQKGSMANIIKAAMERYKMLSDDPNSTVDPRQYMEEIQHSIDESMMLEVPFLEKNLVALSTIASVATMVGLLGTVIGMIRAFQALAQAGAPDAIQLSLGISEALINTAGGLIAAIAAILAYNFFVNKVDNFTYMIDEASYSIMKSLVLHRPKAKILDMNRSYE